MQDTAVYLLLKLLKLKHIMLFVHKDTLHHPKHFLLSFVTPKLPLSSCHHIYLSSLSFKSLQTSFAACVCCMGVQGTGMFCYMCCKGTTGLVFALVRIVLIMKCRWFDFLTFLTHHTCIWRRTRHHRKATVDHELMHSKICGSAYTFDHNKLRKLSRAGLKRHLI